MGVILDVVYNHFGPDGNYLGVFSDDYLIRDKENEWGDAINFDESNSRPVREFFITNGRYWIEEFHFDGFRFDATHAIRDRSKEYIIAAVGRAAREAADPRSIILVAENDLQEAKMVRRLSEGGDDLDGMWNDDFHHSAVVALTGRNEAYYADYLGTPQEFISSAKYGFLYQGQALSWRKVLRGTPTRSGFQHCSRGFRLFHRKSRSNRKYRPGRAVAISNVTRALPRYDRTPSARALDATAVSGTGVRRVQPVHVFCRYRRCFCARSDSQRSC
jgi:1,4-alpha-glucan branching enzyme